MGRQKIELFADRKGEFRWRLVSAQKIIATSGEGYVRKAGVKQAIKSVTKAFTGAVELRIPIVDLTVDVTKTKAPTVKPSRNTRKVKAKTTKTTTKRTTPKRKTATRKTATRARASA
jgi:uncharacterized protein YegP (UPF0339 family)